MRATHPYRVIGRQHSAHVLALSITLFIASILKHVHVFVTQVLLYKDPSERGDSRQHTRSSHFWQELGASARGVELGHTQLFSCLGVSAEMPRISFSKGLPPHSWLAWAHASGGEEEPRKPMEVHGDLGFRHRDSPVHLQCLSSSC